MPVTPYERGVSVYTIIFNCKIKKADLDQCSPATHLSSAEKEPQLELSVDIETETVKKKK